MIVEDCLFVVLKQGFFHFVPGFFLHFFVDAFTDGFDSRQEGGRIPPQFDSHPPPRLCFPSGKKI
jgi:hypothetical protein